MARLGRSEKALTEPTSTSSGNENLSVSSTSVTEGEQVDVNYQGQGPVMYSVDGGPWMEVPIDTSSGTGSITAPPGSRTIVIADQENLNSEQNIEVIASEAP